MPRSCPCHKASRKSKKRNPSHRAKWKDYIRGEYWIREGGESEFADNDIGDVGHEAIAINQLLDKDALIEGLLEAGLIDEDKADEYRDDEYGSSNVYSLETIPDEIGIAAAGSEERWQDISGDARSAYSKYEGAILAINTDFGVWNVTDFTIQSIQEFIMEQVGDETVEDPKTEMCIEEYETRRMVCLPVMEFLTLKHTKEMWLKIETAEMWDSVLKENPFADEPVGRMSTLKLDTWEGWNERPLVRYGSLIVVKRGHHLFLAHHLGLQLGIPRPNRKEVADKARFYNKDPQGMELLARALIAWGSGKMNDPVLVDVATDRSFNLWAWGRRLSKQEKTRRT
jgi:hypothetical protein